MKIFATRLLALGICAAAGLGVALSVGFASGAPPASPNAARSLDLFTAQRGLDDAVPAFIRTLVPESKPTGVPDDLYEGAWYFGRSQRLVHLGGSRDVTVFAVPTSKGQACFALSMTPTNPAMPRGGASCVANFTADNPIGIAVFDPDAVNAGDAPVVSGIAANWVKSVQIIVDGVAQDAKLGGNGFAYQLADTTAYPEAAVVTSFSGDRVVVPIPDPRPGMLKASGS